VEVIGHQAVSQQPHIEPGHGFGQDPFERGEIAVVVQDSESGVGSVQSVIDKSALSGTSRSSHRVEDNERGSDVSTTGPDTFSGAWSVQRRAKT